MQPPDVPEAIRGLAAACADAGGRAYLVGGGVRDHLMGQAVKDWDVEVFGLPAERLSRLLKRRGRVNAVGRSFGVYKWRPRGGAPDDPEIDVSIPRRDSKIGPGHKGIAVEGDPHMPPREAARRRDLTINAMMWDLTDDELYDPFGGRRDLEQRCLRAVDPSTFLEDPLRALRVVQFAARLGFEADDALVALCREASLDELPPERIQGEWGKLLLRGARPSAGFEVARRAHVLRRVFPEVAGLEDDVLLDALVPARDALDEEGRQWALMLSGWLLRAAPETVEVTLDRLWIHRVKGYPVRQRTLDAITCQDVPVEDDADLRRLSTRADLRVLLPLRAAKRPQTADEEWSRADRLGVLDRPPAPVLQGRHLKPLGIPPGPHMGELLRQVYDAQLGGEVVTLDDARDLARRLWDESA